MPINPLYEAEFKQALGEYIKADEYANKFRAQNVVPGKKIKSIDLEEAKAAFEKADKAKKKLEKLKKKYFGDP